MQKVDIQSLLYNKNPNINEQKVIHKDQLKKLCYNRLLAHHQIELSFQNFENHGQFDVSQKDYIIQIYMESEQFLPLGLIDQQTFYLRDQTCHFYLELIFSDTKDNIIKYAKFEKQLLKYRILYLSQFQEYQNILDNLLLNSGIQFKQLNFQQFNQLLQQIENFNLYEKRNLRSTDFYQIPFQYVSRSLLSLNVILNNGIAIVHKEELIHAILNVFEQKLISRMNKLTKNLHFQTYQQQDVQFQLMREYLVYGKLLGNEMKIYPEKVSQCINFELINQISIPLCMRIIQNQLLQQQNLKNLSRFQLQLFQKSIGISVEDCIQYWLANFNKRIIQDKQFEQEIVYNIRHVYGLEGQRNDYQCKSCHSIQESQITNEYSGCPIKTFNRQQFQKLLDSSHFLNSQQKSQIMNYKLLEFYDVSCQLILKSEHSHFSDHLSHEEYNKGKLIIRSPKDYFNHSITLQKNEKNDTDLK